MATNAEKLDLELWEASKAAAREKFGGHSARAMQYAVKLYKEAGGRYKGRKRVDNRLVQWTRQDWTTKSGKPSRETGERYLPRAAIAALTSAEYGATSRAKRAGGGAGKSVPQPASIREKTRKFRKVNPDMATAKQIAARKRFAEMARSGELAKMRNKAAKRNPAKTVSQEISAQVRKGKPQRQAVAIALEMERAGKLKKNPMPRVPQIIYEQLGANKFVAMTGAKDFVYGENMLMFSIPHNMSPYNKVRITYSPGADLYDMEFLKVTRAAGVAKAEPYNNVYAEQLRELFTMVTGMQTSLGTMGRRSNPTPTKARAVKKNPITETLIYGLPQGETRDYMEELLYGGGLKLTDAQINQVLKAASDAGYHSFRIAGFDPTMRPDFKKAIATKSRRKRNPTANFAPKSRTKLVEGKRKKNPANGYEIRCARSGRVLGYAATMPMAKSMATAIANERNMPVQVVKA